MQTHTVFSHVFWQVWTPAVLIKNVLRQSWSKPMNHSQSHFSHVIIAKHMIALAGKLYMKHGGL